MGARRARLETGWRCILPLRLITLGGLRCKSIRTCQGALPLRRVVARGRTWESIGAGLPEVPSRGRDGRMKRARGDGCGTAAAERTTHNGWMALHWIAA